VKVLAIISWLNMKAYLHNLQSEYVQKTTNFPVAGGMINQASLDRAIAVQNEWARAKAEWVTSMDNAITAQRAIIETKTKSAKEDAKEYLEQLIEQQKEILALQFGKTTDSARKPYYEEMRSAEIDLLWHNTFTLRQAYAFYDCLSSVITIESNFNDLHMNMVSPKPISPYPDTQMLTTPNSS